MAISIALDKVIGYDTSNQIVVNLLVGLCCNEHGRFHTFYVVSILYCMYVDTLCHKNHFLYMYNLEMG